MDSLSQFFASLTVHDCLALSESMIGAKELGQCNLLQSAAKFPNKILGAASREADNSDYWEMETGTASFRTTFDPESGRRRDIIANSRHATLYGVHPEEFQARCANRDLSFPFAEADAVALTIYGTVCEQLKSQAPPERFLRLYVGGAAVLCSARISVVRDAFGRISEV
jgi:hypothetical protein